MAKPTHCDTSRGYATDSAISLAPSGVAAVNSFVERSLTGAAARYVERIWLDINNRDEVFQVLPDGCVDVVLELGTDAGQIVAYGSTTKPAITPLRVGLHYLGIRFQPGMARHFFDHSPVGLTDRHIGLIGFLGLDLEQLTQGVQRGAGLLQLETALLHGLSGASACPVTDRSCG